VKMHVMHDQSGKIVAAVRLDDDSSQPGRPGHRTAPPRPVPTPGFTSIEVEVPAEHSHLSFKEACEQLMIETAGGKPYFKLRRR
jgi:hypothetical protein